MSPRTSSRSSSPATPERIHPAFNALDLALRSRGEGAEGHDGHGFRLKIANALWGQQGYHYTAPFLDLLAENYGAGLRLLDFIASPEPSRVKINDWIEEQTQPRGAGRPQPGSGMTQPLLGRVRRRAFTCRMAIIDPIHW